MAEHNDIKSPLSLLWSRRPTLHPVLRKVCDFILEDPERTANLSIGQLSEQVGASKTTVVRLCKTLGFSGFREFRSDLLRETTRMQSKSAGGIATNHSSEIRSLLQYARRAYDDMLKLLDPSAFNIAVSKLAEAKHIAWYGTGLSGHLAEMADHRFSIAGFDTRAISEPTRLLAEAQRFSAEDVIVFVSHSGTTGSVVTPLKKVVETPVFTIGITNFVETPVALLCDCALITGDRELSVGDLAFSWRHSQQLLLDTLVLAVVKRVQP